MFKEAVEANADGEFERVCRRCCDYYHGIICYQFEPVFSALRPKNKIKITVAALFVALIVLPHLSVVLSSRIFRAGRVLEDRQRRTVIGFRNQPEPAKVHSTSFLKDRDKDVSHTVHNAEAQFSYASGLNANSIDSERHKGKTNDFGAISTPIAWRMDDDARGSSRSEGRQKPGKSEDVTFSSPENGKALEMPHGFPGDVAQGDHFNVVKEIKSPNRSLGEILEAAALPNKTVIIASLNAAWAENNTMIDMFLEGFHEGNDTDRLLKNLIIVAFDQKAFDRCIRIHEHCLKIETPGVDFSQEKFINSEDFLKMMWRRVQFLGTVLEMGYSFIFTDADILWLRDPFPRLKAMGVLDQQQADMAVASDHFNGNASDTVSNAANTGFIYARAIDRTRAVYRYWYDARERYPRKKEQDVFNAIKRQHKFQAIGLRLRILDNQFFAAFCSIGNSDLAKVVTMHGACCRGLNAKLHDLRTVLDSWNFYLAHPPANSSIPSPRFKRPRACPRSWPRRPKIPPPNPPNQSKRRAL